MTKSMIRSIRLSMLVGLMVVSAVTLNVLTVGAQSDRPWTKVGENPDGTLRCSPVSCHPPFLMCCLGGGEAQE